MKRILKLLVLDHPIVDIIATVPMSFLNKYGLPKNATVKLRPELKPIYGELLHMKGCHMMAAGSAMNSLRATQHIIREKFPNSTLFMGSVGKDAYSKILIDSMHEHGMDASLYHHDEYPTGVCAALLNDEDRCLIPNLGAAEHFPDEHTKLNWHLVESASSFYSTSYFMSTNFPTMKEICFHGAYHGKPVYFNLAAKNWVINYSDRLLSLLPSLEGIIGNHEEGQALANILGLPWEKMQMKDIVHHLCKAEVQNRRRHRFVVITNATESTVIGERCSNGSINIQELQTPKIEKGLVKTTNGAGDTLAGGVLGGLILGEELIPSFRRAQKLVCYFIQQDDGSFPKDI